MYSCESIPQNNHQQESSPSKKIKILQNICIPTTKVEKSKPITQHNSESYKNQEMEVNIQCDKFKISQHLKNNLNEYLVFPISQNDTEIHIKENTIQKSLLQDIDYSNSNKNQDETHVESNKKSNLNNITVSTFFNQDEKYKDQDLLYTDYLGIFSNNIQISQESTNNSLETSDSAQQNIPDTKKNKRCDELLSDTESIYSISDAQNMTNNFDIIENPETKTAKNPPQSQDFLKKAIGTQTEKNVARNMACQTCEPHFNTNKMTFIVNKKFTNKNLRKNIAKLKSLGHCLNSLVNSEQCHDTNNWDRLQKVFNELVNSFE